MILGIDRSHNNAPYPLSKLAEQSIKFCFFKATEGTMFEDPAFNKSWQEAKDVEGFIRGAYHFYQPSLDGKEQCDHFLSVGMDFSAKGALPGVIDVEDLVGKDAVAKNKWIADNWELCLQRLQDFLDYYKANTGKDCIIYSYNNYMREYYHSHPFPNNPMWLSSIQPNTPKRYDNGQMPMLWQNTYNWNSTDMDGDVFLGTQDELNALANIV